MKESKRLDEYAGKISGIEAKFKNLGSTLEDATMVRKLLNFVPKKYMEIVASIEQYSDIDIMPFEEAVGRLKTYKERLKSHDDEENDQGQLLLTKEDWEERTRRGDFDQPGQGRGRGRGQGRGRGYGRGRGGRFQSNEDRKDQDHLCYFLSVIVQFNPTQQGKISHNNSDSNNNKETTVAATSAEQWGT
ncbi:uncharacterized protein LOC110866855 [Helianthus annuus]|uniref:uncharacterized protein LOC110866855 n=1 Tax=Helianthus annuus TaxID=4232 RepID=UPI000B900C64|nr:uncharacterized protein LOC110866855 [Helianthus annuus]